jgi:hypothetical protein
MKTSRATLELSVEDAALFARICVVRNWQDMGLHFLGGKISIPGRTIGRFFRANPNWARLRRAGQGHPPAEPQRMNPRPLTLEAIRQIESWPIRSDTSMARTTGFSPYHIKQAIDSDPAMAAKKRAARGVKTKLRQALRGWSELTAPEMVSCRGYFSAKALFKRHPKLRAKLSGLHDPPARAPLPYKGLRIPQYFEEQKLRLLQIPGWQNLLLREIAAKMGKSRVWLHGLLKDSPEMAALVQGRPKPSPRWTVKKMEEINRTHRTADEAARAMGVSVSRYQELTMRLSVGRLPSEARLASRNGQADIVSRLDQVPEWRNLSYAKIGVALGITHARVHELFKENPALWREKQASRPSAKSLILAVAGWQEMPRLKLAQASGATLAAVCRILRVDPDMAEVYRPVTPTRKLVSTEEVKARIMAVKDWVTKPYSRIGTESGIFDHKVRSTILKDAEMRSIHRGSPQKDRRARAPKRPLTPEYWGNLRVRIRTLKDWRKKSYPAMARELGAPPDHVQKSIQMSRSMHAEMDPLRGPTKKIKLCDVILKVEGWQTMTYADIARELKLRNTSVGRAIRTAPEMAKKHVQTQTLWGRTRLARELKKERTHV